MPAPRKKTYTSTPAPGQKVKTYYEPKTRSGDESAYKRSDVEIKEAHADRRQLNRGIRDRAQTPLGKTKQAIGSAVGWVQERGRAINAPDPSNRAAGPVATRPSNPFGTMGNGDLFGVGNMGSPFTRTPAARAYAPRRDSEPPKRRKRRRAPAPERDTRPFDPFGINKFRRIF